MDKKLSQGSKAQDDPGTQDINPVTKSQQSLGKKISTKKPEPERKGTETP
jgi:hypothetical protein